MFPKQNCPDNTRRSWRLLCRLRTWTRSQVRAETCRNKRVNVFPLRPNLLWKLQISFSGLFSELDCQPNLGIINYGVSMTTLEDVFLRLEAEAEVDQAGECVTDRSVEITSLQNWVSVNLSICSDYSVFNREQVEVEYDNTSLDDTDQRLLTFSDNKSDVTGHALWRQQFSTVAWLHMLNMRRERKAFIYTWDQTLKQHLQTSLISFFHSFFFNISFFHSLALFLVFVAAVLVLSLATGNIQINSPDRQFLPIYLLKKNQAPHRYSTSLLVQNSSGEKSFFLCEMTWYLIA